jgi:cytochrome c556
MPVGGDARRPLYLLPMMAEHQKQNMREHLAAVNGIVAALAKGDFGAVRAAAKKLGTTPEMQQMCMNFGAATPGFSERALAFHATADGLSAAAAAADTQKVLGALSATLNSCVSCHAAYRQEVVDQERWRQLTSPR